MIRHFFRCWVLLMFCFLVGCGAQPPAATSSSSAAAASKPVTLAPVTDEQALAFAETLTKSVYGESDAQSSVDWSRLIDRAALGLEMKPKSLEAFRKGVMQSMVTNGLGSQIQAQIKLGASYKRLRTHQTPEGTRVTMRLLLAGGGVNYHDYLLASESGNVSAVDINLASVGEDMSATFRRLMIPLVARDNRGFLDRLSGTESLFIKHSGELERASKMIQGGQPETALQVLNALPLEMQNEKFVLVMQIGAAQLAGNDASVLAAIERFRSQFPTDPATALYSIDYYITRKEFLKAIEALEQLKTAVGGDAELDTMIANVRLEAGDIPGAKVAIEQAIAREPDLPSSYWSKISVALTEDDHATTLATLIHLKSELNIALSAESLKTEVLYSKFVLSPEFQELEEFLAE